MPQAQSTRNNKEVKGITLKHDEYFFRTNLFSIINESLPHSQNEMNKHTVDTKKREVLLAQASPQLFVPLYLTCRSCERI